jgi:hypothetical protein
MFLIFLGKVDAERETEPQGKMIALSAYLKLVMDSQISIWGWVLLGYER